MFKMAIPVLHVSRSLTAEDFYCNQLGFRRAFAYRIDEAKADPCYMGLTRDNAELHLSSFSGDGVAGGVVFVVVASVDDLYEELTRKFPQGLAGMPQLPEELSGAIHANEGVHA